MKRVLSVVATLCLAVVCSSLVYLYYLLDKHNRHGLYDPDAFWE